VAGNHVDFAFTKKLISAHDVRMPYDCLGSDPRRKHVAIDEYTGKNAQEIKVFTMHRFRTWTLNNRSTRSVLVLCSSF